MREPTSRSATDLEFSPPPATEGLGRLDQDRALSLADEGGVSAAGLESQEPTNAWYLRKVAVSLAAFALGAFTLWALRRRFRS